MATETHQLLLVRQLADEADRQLTRDDDFGNGLAVSVMQDAVELLLRSVVRVRSITVERQAGFESLITAIDRAAAADGALRVPHVARIQDLNKARVSFEHAGTAPSRVDAVRLVRFGLDALESGCEKFFGIEYRSISLMLLIKRQDVRDLLVEAEALLEAGKYKEAMIEAADAVGLTETQMIEYFPAVRHSGDMGDASPALLNYLNGLRMVSLGGVVGFNVRDLMRFRGLAPRVARDFLGKRSVTFLGPPTYEDEHVEFAIRFACDFALATQRELGSRHQFGTAAATRIARACKASEPN